MKTVKIDLNNMVTVRLSEKGSIIYLEYLKNQEMHVPPKIRLPLSKIEEMVVKAEFYGLYVQMYELANIFAGHMWPGCDAPFNSSIEMEVPE